MSHGPLLAALAIGFIGTDDNVSDSMTKATAIKKFREHRDKLLQGFTFTDQLQPADFTSFFNLVERDIDRLFFYNCEADIELM